jgi:opacity protein-like surface antigen
MIKQFMLSGAVTLGVMTSAIAGPYYAGLSYVDSEVSTLESNGYAITVGRKLDLLSNVDTAVQITYAEHGDDDFTSDNGNPLNGEATSTEIAAVFAYDLGFAKPFVLLGYEATDFDFSGASGSGSIDDDGFYYGVGLDYALGENLGLRFEMTYDEFTDDTNEEFDVETIRLGLIRNF